jgi:putative lipoprotein
VVVLRVVPGSVAQRIGLEAGDTILTVSGYQVGMVEGRIYDVGEEISRRMNRQGSATLLVLNQRNGQLINIPVETDVAPDAAVLGTVMTNDRQSVFPSMMMDLRIIDVTHPQWRDVTIAETQLAVTGRWPLSFRLDYDPTVVRPNHRYAIEAQISYLGQVIQRTASPVPVNLAGASPRVALKLDSVQSLPSQPFPGGGAGGGSGSPVDQVDGWYLQYLGRNLTDRERSVWQRELSRGKPLDEILGTILGSSEYHERFRGNQRAYIADVFQSLYGRTPTPQEIQRWQTRLAQLRDDRFKMVREMQRESGR